MQELSCTLLPSLKPLKSFCPIVPFEKVFDMQVMSITCKLSKPKYISWAYNFRPFCILKVYVSVELMLYFKRCSTTKYSGSRSCSSRLWEKARFPKLCLLNCHQRKIILLFYEGGGNVSSRLSARLGTEEQVEAFDCSPVLFREKAWCQLFFFLWVPLWSSLCITSNSHITLWEPQVQSPPS